MRRPSSRKHRLFEYHKDICHKIGAVHFGVIGESVDNIESARIPYHCKYEFVLWMSSLGFVIPLSLDRVRMRGGDLLKKNHYSSPVTRWCHLSRSAACKNGSIALACSFRFSRKSSVNTCGTQCKWNDLKPIESCKCRNTVGWATSSLSAIEWSDSNGDLSNIARFFASRSSNGGLLVRISSCKSWRPSYIFVIQNWTFQSW
jgi:hypothetical protein